MVRLRNVLECFRNRSNLLIGMIGLVFLRNFRSCHCFMIQRDKIKSPPKFMSTVSTSLRQNRTSRVPTFRAPNTAFSTSRFDHKRATMVNPLQIESVNTTQSAVQWNATSAMLFGTFIIVGLAGTSETPTTDPMLGALGTVSNVIDAALPTSSTDLVAVALGEGIAGTIGAVLSATLRSLASSDRKPLVTEALSESDYFIVQASLLPTLRAVGVSPILATVSSVFVASVPSQLVKLNSKQKQRRIAEEKSLLKLLEQEQQRQQQDRNIFLETAAEIRRIRPAVEDRVDPATLKPITNSTVDFVEVFSDVTRWLGYGVLSDYSDLITWDDQPVEPGLSGAVLGLIAAFSSTLYADVLYGVFHYGPESKQREVRERRTREWIAHYTSASISGATLFGVYEQSQGPASRWIQGTLAGGVDGCIGSDSFKTCFDTYIQENAPGPSPEAQARALYTNLVMVCHRIQDVASDTSSDDVERLLRAWAVSANSFFNSYFASLH